MSRSEKSWAGDKLSFCNVYLPVVIRCNLNENLQQIMYVPSTFSHMICGYRSKMVVHQPGDPDLHWVLWHPPGDGGPHLPHTVHGAWQARNLRTFGESVKMFIRQQHTRSSLLIPGEILGKKCSVSTIWSLNQNRCMILISPAAG